MNISVSPLYISVDTKNPCKARLTADGKIESLFEFLLPVSTTNLAGNSTISLDLSGTLEQPQVTGQIRINNGTFELIGVGGSAHHVNAVVDIKNMHEAAVQLSAQGNGGGTITGHGTADLSLQPLLPFDLSFQLHQIPLQPSSYAHVIASGDLRLKGDFEKGILEGKLVSDSVSVSIPEHIPELAHTIDVTYVNHQTHRPLPTACRTPAIPGWPLAYNLEFEIPRHCMLRGQDWTSEWKGNAILTGTNEKLLLNGSCKVIRGEYRFNGQVFDIKEGTITFAGSPKKTSLYVIAGKDIETMHVEVIAKGLVSEPAIVFRSNPPMSQREILSWILFNRGTSEISTFQGTQLNESITSLNRGNNRSDVLTKIRDRIGIDKIDICRSRDADSNAVSVQLGKYITRGVLLSIHKSITDEVNRVSVEADLMKNVKIQAQVGDDAAGQMTLKWKRDY